MENSPMKILRFAATTAALLLSLGASLQAQTTLRIGLAEDPDILDPTLGRTYVGRIVFASFCDKLFDIDEKLNIVPQLALSHETSDDGKEVFIKLRPGVKFHDGEPFDAEAAKFSLDRDVINQVVFNGEFKPGNQWVNPDHPYYQKAFPVRGRDAAKAKALLKEAGVAAPVSVDFMVLKGAETEAVAQVIQSMAAETGFDMKIRVTEFATSLKQAEAGEYQAYMLAWSGRIDPDGNSYIFQKTEAPQNYSAWSNLDADKALDDGRLV